jgi:hypothetical protein
LFQFGEAGDADLPADVAHAFDTRFAYLSSRSLACRLHRRAYQGKPEWPLFNAGWPNGRGTPMIQSIMFGIALYLTPSLLLVVLMTCRAGFDYHSH